MAKDYDYGQLIDDFELGADVMPGESLTDYIERRRREFESKADGGSIGIEVLFGPKREDFNIGGNVQRATTPQPYDSRATAADFARALNRVGAGTDLQKAMDIDRYGKNVQRQNMLSKIKDAGTNLGMTDPLTGILQSKMLPGAAGMQSLAQINTIRDKVLAAQEAQQRADSGLMDPVTGKRYMSQQEAIDDLGIVTYNQRFADGGRVGMISGGFLKGIGSFFKAGKDKIDDIIETKAMEKVGFRSKDDIPLSTYSEMKAPIKLSEMENIPEDQLKKILRTQELGLYKETPEILKAANLLERFTKKVGGKRVIDYERAEDILNVKLKGNETLDELFKIEFRTRPENRLADGGRVGLFMGGDPLTGQALSIYESMNAYGFTDQQIANALQGQGLYTPSGSGTPETTAPNIINQQLQTGGDRDNNFGGQGIGSFGNLDPNTKKTMQVEVADGKGGVMIKEVDTYLDTGGMRKTLDNKNPVNAGLDIKTPGIAIFESLFGKKTDDKFLEEGKILGPFNNPNYKDLSFFGKIKADASRQKELKQLQKEFELQEQLKKQIAKEEADRAAQYGKTNYGIGSDGQQSYDSGQGFGINATTGGPVSNRTGRGRTDYSKGGLATMFTRRR